MSKNPPVPPKWPDRFLAWFCNDEVREQVQGDAHELFYWRVGQRGVKEARRAFLWDVVRLFKWSNIRRTYGQGRLNHIAMFKNYFKTGLRNLWKQRVPSLINTVGLSLAIGCCLVAYKFIESSLIKDRFHENGADIYMLTHTAFVDNESRQYGYLSTEVSNLLREGFPEVKRVVRYTSQGILVKKGTDKLFSHAAFVDDGFFDSFSFPILYGDQHALSSPRNVVITESTALQFFGTEDPLGQVITLDFNQTESDFVVAAVCEEPPLSSSLRLGVVINYALLEEGIRPDKLNSSVFVELKERATGEDFHPKLQELAELQSSFEREHQYEGMGMVPLADISRRADEIEGSVAVAPNLAPIILLACIALFMLALATFNYINIAMVMAGRRLKEIGLRKVIGGRKGQLIAQFLTENLILCTLATGIGCLLAAGFFLPQFSLISGATFTLNLSGDTSLWFFLLGLLLFITLVSGAYPAFLVSSFKPAKILRGGERIEGKKRFMNSLLSFQFTLATITIIAAVMFIHTNQVNENRDWGYDQHNKLVVNLGPQIYPKMRDQALKNPNVIGVAGSRGTVGKSYISARVLIEDQEHHAEILRGGADYARVLGLKLLEGRHFDSQLKSEVQSSVLVNEAFMKSFGLDFSGDQMVTVDSANYLIVGVLADFHYHAFDDRIGPAVLRMIPDTEVTHMTVHTAKGALPSVEKKLLADWEQLVKESDFESYRQADAFEGHFRDMRGVRNIILFTATLAIILSAMGLFGLVSLSISSRIKDFGIRKVLGASAFQLSKGVYHKFTWVLGIAIVSGSTLGTFIIGMLLDSAYGYHQSVNLATLGITACILIGMAALTINAQMSRVRKMNPADILRTE